MKSRLESKYNTDALNKIKAAVERWKNADADRGIHTVHVEVDNPEDETMKEQGVPPVSGEATAEKIKQAVDVLWNKLEPDYLVLFGGDEIVPMFQVPNPSIGFKGHETPIKSCRATVPMQRLRPFCPPTQTHASFRSGQSVASPIWCLTQILAIRSGSRLSKHRYQMETERCHRLPGSCTRFVPRSPGRSHRLHATSVCQSWLTSV